MCSEKVLFDLVSIGGYLFNKEHPDKMMPKDTNITKYFVFDGRIFADMTLPDGRHMINIVHIWGDDGELMEFGYQYSDGIARSGFNPLSIVRIYDMPVSQDELREDLEKFLKRYYKETLESAGTGN